MNGYSKIDTITTRHKSKSIDFFSFPAKPTTDADHKEETKELDEKGERFGVILGKSSSVSSSSSGYGFHARMKRAISMRRCSSVTERYCRIHDQNMAIASDHDTDATAETRSVNNKKHKGGNILKACKRLLGF